VKPKKTKLFTGFVYTPFYRDLDYNDHDQEQLNAFRKLDPAEEIWLCPVVRFAGEWRYYVKDGQVVGHARYDADGQDDVRPPQTGFIETACQAVWQSLGHAFALDIGVLKESGQNVVIELNDAWAIDLYSDGPVGATLSNLTYLQFLFSRWKSLINV
jgi:ATP-grasp domain, R2K clade family 3